MRQIKLDFQQTHHSIWRLAGLFLLFAGLILNVLLYVKNQNTSTETNDILNQIERIKHPAKAVTIPVDDIQTATEKNQLLQVDAVIKQLNLPWPDLFKILETTRESSIDLLELSPNSQTGDVLIIGKADNLKSVFDYIERLKKSRVFSKIDLNSHEKTLQNGIQVLRFNIVAKWLSNNE